MFVCGRDGFVLLVLTPYFCEVKIIMGTGLRKPLQREVFPGRLI